MATRKRQDSAAARVRPPGGRRAAPHQSAALQPGRLLPRVPKGKRVRFHADPNVDRLFAIVAALTAELSVVSERLLTLERVLAERGQLASDAIETHEIDEAEAALRLKMREGLIERVFQALEQDA
jgi:hypothetical protein